MGRSFKRKTPKRDTSVLQRAVAAMKLGMSCKRAAREFKVPRSTLQLHWKNNRNEPPTDTDSTTTPMEVNLDDLHIATHGTKTVFTKEQEDALEKHMLHTSDIYFGLTAMQARVLAYEFAKKLDISYPTVWDKQQSAGLEWFRSFLKRYPTLSLRKPEATSLASVSAFNRANVAAFLANYQQVMEEIKVTPNNIWNVDETGVTTVHRTIMENNSDSEKIRWKHEHQLMLQHEQRESAEADDEFRTEKNEYKDVIKAEPANAVAEVAQLRESIDASTLSNNDLQTRLGRLEEECRQKDATIAEHRVIFAEIQDAVNRILNPRPAILSGLRPLPRPILCPVKI